MSSDNVRMAIEIIEIMIVIVITIVVIECCWKYDKYNITESLIIMKMITNSTISTTTGVMTWKMINIENKELMTLMSVLSCYSHNNTDCCVWSGHQVQETPAVAHHLHGRKHQDPFGRLSHHGPRVVPAAVGQDWSAWPVWFLPLHRPVWQGQCHGGQGSFSSCVPVTVVGLVHLWLVWTLSLTDLNLVCVWQMWICIVPLVWILCVSDW